MIPTDKAWQRFMLQRSRRRLRKGLEAMYKDKKKVDKIMAYLARTAPKPPLVSIGPSGIGGPYQREI